MDDFTRSAVSNWIRSTLYFAHRQRNYLIPRQEEIAALKGSAPASEDGLLLLARAYAAVGNRDEIAKFQNPDSFERLCHQLLKTVIENFCGDASLFGLQADFCGKPAIELYFINDRLCELRRCRTHGFAPVGLQQWAVGRVPDGGDDLLR